MRYFFVLGNHPRLSLAELSCVLKQTDAQTVGQLAIFDIKHHQQAKNLINLLGGTIKIGEIIQKTNQDNLVAAITQLIQIRTKTDKKFYFGLSAYNFALNLKTTALAVKKELKRQGLNTRWVQSKEPRLSSVAVKTNKLLTDRGAEIIITSCNHFEINNDRRISQKGNNLWLGLTQAVQPFAEFSRRDYGRPARDARSGMLPPKIARLMINLAQVSQEAVILDPFCGSGTILQEALLLGYKNIIGSDVSRKAVEAAKKNLTWLAQLPDRGLSRQTIPVKLLPANVRHLNRIIPTKSVNAIITEPYLGPPLRGNEPLGKTKQILDELAKLYLDSFKEFVKILKPNGRIVIILPIISGQRLNILEQLKKLGIQPSKKFTPWYNDLQRSSFLYRRPGQKVQREIFIFLS